MEEKNIEGQEKNKKPQKIENNKKKILALALALVLLIGGTYAWLTITLTGTRTTRIEAINISGTLNQSSGGERSIAKVPILKMPTKFYHIGFKEGSDNTIEVVCDEGWQISMRIHNASSRVEPSLKFDVQLVSFPSSVYTQTEPWDGPDVDFFNRIAVYAGLLIKR